MKSGLMMILESAAKKRPNVMWKEDSFVKMEEVTVVTNGWGCEGKKHPEMDYVITRSCSACSGGSDQSCLPVSCFICDLHLHQRLECN